MAIIVDSNGNAAASVGFVGPNVTNEIPTHGHLISGYNQLNAVAHVLIENRQYHMTPSNARFAMKLAYAPSITPSEHVKFRNLVGEQLGRDINNTEHVDSMLTIFEGSLKDAREDESPMFGQPLDFSGTRKKDAASEPKRKGPQPKAKRGDILNGLGEIAEFLGVSQPTVSSLIHEGLPCFMLGGRRCALKSSLMSWMKLKERGAGHSDGSRQRNGYGRRAA